MPGDDQELQSLDGWPPEGTPSPRIRPEHREPAFLAELLSGSPREVQRRLQEGDPLAIGDRAYEAIAETALMMQPERVCYRTAARLAIRAAGFPGAEQLDEWINEAVGWSLLSLVQEDADQELLGSEAPEGWEQNFAFFAGLFEIDPADARGMCVRFNLQPHAVRVAFHRVVIQGTLVPDYARQVGLPKRDVVTLLKEAYLALLTDPRDHGGPTE